MKKPAVIVFLLAAVLSHGFGQPSDALRFAGMASRTLDSLYKYYSVPGSPLLRENYPYDKTFRADYLAAGQAASSNPYSYLWPFSGTLSAVAALVGTTAGDAYAKILEEKVVPGLEKYYDARRQPAAYASYVGRRPSDRFYDDNVWIGIDFLDIYFKTGDKRYLEKAEDVWKFIESGTDDILGGGIYWCEQKKGSKNTCSNAPGTVYACKLYKATRHDRYLEKAKKLYAWTKKTLQDPGDNLYYDNVSIQTGRISRKKFSYNSGQMMQAAALLYGLTGDVAYLKDAQKIASSCHMRFLREFTTPGGETFRLGGETNMWFTAVMMRGFAELYRADRNPVYMDSFKRSVLYAWDNARSPQGFIYTDWSGQGNARLAEAPLWLLSQAATVEIMARLSEYCAENQQTDK